MVRLDKRWGRGVALRLASHAPDLPTPPPPPRSHRTDSPAVAAALPAHTPRNFGASLAASIVATLLTRFVSVGSILAAASLAPLAWFFYPGEWILFSLACLAGVLAIYRHKSNIQRLLAGTESRFGSGKRKDAP